MNGSVYLLVLFIFLMKTIEVSASFFANFDAMWSSDTLSMPQKQLKFRVYNCSPQIASSLSLIGYAIIETNEQKFDCTLML